MLTFSLKTETKEVSLLFRSFEGLVFILSELGEGRPILYRSAISFLTACFLFRFFECIILPEMHITPPTPNRETPIPSVLGSETYAKPKKESTPPVAYKQRPVPLFFL